MCSKILVQMFYTLLPLEWKRYINDLFSLWNVDKTEIAEFIVLENSHHPTQLNLRLNLSHHLFKGERFNKQVILDIRTHFKPTETSSTLTSLPAIHQWVRKGFIKGEALLLLRTNSSARPSFENTMHPIQNTPLCERLPQQSSRKNKE